MDEQTKRKPGRVPTYTQPRTRINIYLDAEKHEFAQTIGRVTGKGLTGIINDALEAYQKEHVELYETCKQAERLAGKDL